MADVAHLVQRVLRGDVDAFEGIIEAYQREVWTVVAYYLPERSRIQELVDAVFVKCYCSLDAYDPARDFGNWLRTIARNEVKMELRRLANSRSATLQYAERLAAEAALSEVDQDRSARMRDYLDDCLRRLTAEQQALLSLRYQEGLSVARIAEQTRRSVDAVKKNLSRVRSQLRACIERKAISGVS